MSARNRLLRGYRLDFIPSPGLLQPIDNHVFSCLESRDHAPISAVLAPNDDFPPFDPVLRINHINEIAELFPKDRRLFDHDAFLQGGDLDYDFDIHPRPQQLLGIFRRGLGAKSAVLHPVVPCGKPDFLLVFFAVLKEYLHLGVGDCVFFRFGIVFENSQHGKFIDGEKDFDIARACDSGKGPTGRADHVADAVVFEPDITIEGSQDSRIAEIDFFLSQPRFGGFQFRLGDPQGHFRRFEILSRGRVGFQKGFLPFEFNLFVGQFGIAFIDIGFRFVDRRLINRRVDLEKFGAFFYQITFFEIGFGQESGNVGGKMDGVVCLNLSDFGHRIGKFHFDDWLDDDHRHGARLRRFFVAT